MAEQERAVAYSEWNERDDQRIVERLREAAHLLRDCIDVDSNKRGGVPVLKGTRVPIALILAELAGNTSVTELAEDLDLREDLVRNLLQGLAIQFDRPFTP